MAIPCFNPSCKATFLNETAVARHCGKVEACQWSRLAHYVQAPALGTKWAQVAMTAEDVPGEDNIGSYRTGHVGSVKPDSHVNEHDEMDVDAQEDLPAHDPTSWLSSRTPIPAAADSQAPNCGDPIPNAKFWSWFERLCEQQLKKGEAVFEPFEDEEHWQLVEWLVESGLSGVHIDKMLELKIISLCIECYTQDWADGVYSWKAAFV
jgi:hypothetical protein